ncbi:MAG: PfkB family carbohydrate kinase [Eubacteriales bacterium]|nr:PfkB family carbohydrate kinase [Eubacteriales bacterium]
MKSYDLMIIGPATRDVNIDYTGQQVCDAGGAVTFCTPAARATGAAVFAAVKIAPEDRELLEKLGGDPADCALLPSARTTLMRNEYFTPDRERRNSSCPAQSDPVLPEEIPEVPCKLYHLAGLLSGDFPGALLEHLHTRGLLSADAQGFLRHNENGRMVFHDWKQKLQYLPYLDFLKTDAAEAEILTGLTDRREAAKVLYGWGAREILISHNSEMLVYDGKDFYTCPVKARNLSGRTGRGDTTFGAYLAMRMLGTDVPAALLYATACVSLKMETPGVFRGTLRDVEDYIREFYR